MKLNFKTTEIMDKRIVERRFTTTGRLRNFEDSMTLGLIAFEFYSM
jgi:hypothetical protein